MAAGTIKSSRFLHELLAFALSDYSEFAHLLFCVVQDISLVLLLGEIVPVKAPFYALRAHVRSLAAKRYETLESVKAGKELPQRLLEASCDALDDNVENDDASGQPTD